MSSPIINTSPDTNISSRHALWNQVFNGFAFYGFLEAYSETVSHDSNEVEASSSSIKALMFKALF